MSPGMFLGGIIGKAFPTPAPANPESPDMSSEIIPFPGPVIEGLLKPNYFKKQQKLVLTFPYLR